MNNEPVTRTQWALIVLATVILVGSIVASIAAVYAVWPRDPAIWQNTLQKALRNLRLTADPDFGAWVAEYQTLFAGLFAVLAATATIMVMLVIEIRTTNRSTAQMELGLRRDRLKIDRLSVPFTTFRNVFDRAAIGLEELQGALGQEQNKGDPQLGSLHALTDTVEIVLVEACQQLEALKAECGDLFSGSLSRNIAEFEGAVRSFQSGHAKMLGPFGHLVVAGNRVEDRPLDQGKLEIFGAAAAYALDMMLAEFDALFAQYAVKVPARTRRLTGKGHTDGHSRTLFARICNVISAIRLRIRS